MNKELLNGRLEFDPDKDRRAISSILEAKVVSDICDQASVRCDFETGSAHGMELVFVEKENRDVVKGINIFDLPECIGIFLRLGNERYHDAEARLLRDSWVAAQVENGAQVAIMDTDLALQWALFYQQIEKENWISKVGKRILECSGLGVKTHNQVSALWEALDPLIERDYGGWAESVSGDGVVATVNNEDGGLDVVFVDEKGEASNVWMRNVRQARRLRGQLLEEVVITEPQQVPGWIVIRAGENKRQAYTRAMKLRQQWRRERGERVQIPVVTSGQLSLWRKLSSVELIRAQVEKEGIDVGVSVDDVIRFLYLGESNLSPGPLARMGLSLPSRGGGIFGVDIIFYQTGLGGAREYAELSDVVCLDLKRLKGGEVRYSTLNNVGGIMLLPDGMNTDALKSRARGANTMYTRLTLNPDRNVLILTPTLLDEWRRRNNPINGLHRSHGEQRLRQRVKYGYGLADLSDSRELVIFQSGPQIGGNKLLLRENGKEASVSYWIDKGTSFENARALTDRAPAATGIWTQLQSGEMPMVPGDYAKSHILRTVAGNQHLLNDRGSIVASFLRAELAAREMGGDLSSLVGWSIANKIMQIAEEDVSYWYGERQKTVAGMMITHAHVDHVGMMTANDPEQRIFASEETLAYLRAMTARARAATDAYTYVPDVTVKYPYPRTDRDLRPVQRSGQVIRLSSHLIAKPWWVNHSIGGAVSWGIESSYGEPLALVTGDFKPGDKTDRTASQVAGRYPTVVTESTNREIEVKPSAGARPEMVLDTMLTLGDKAKGKGIVVVAPANNLERLGVLMQVAERLGRNLAIMPEMAEVIHQLSVTRSNLVLDSTEPFEAILPDIGTDLAIWQRPKLRPMLYEVELQRMAMLGSVGVLDAERLSRVSGDWIVVESPYRRLDNVFAQVDFPRGVDVWHSAYYPHQADARTRIAENMGWISKFGGGNYCTDFKVVGKGGRVSLGRNYLLDSTSGGLRLHNSGHGTFEEIYQILKVITGSFRKGTRLVLIHGQSPGSYRESLIRRIQEEMLPVPEIVWQIDRYDVASGRVAGHVIRLGE